METVDLPLFGQTLSFSLSNFEGPLELLLYLIQKEEIDLTSVALKELTDQFAKELELATLRVDLGADFLWNSSRLLLLKSRLLLPKDELSPLTEEGEFRMEILHKLIEYAKLKEMAKRLGELEEEERRTFPRAVPELPVKRGSGLDEIEKNDLALLLAELMERFQKLPPAAVKGEEWEIAPKMAWLMEKMPQVGRLPFWELFAPEKPKGEWIVFFLALLELMKLQKIKVMLEEGVFWIYHAESV